MKLYFSRGACSLAPHIILMESGLRYQIEKVDLKTKTYSGGDFKKINPKGSVPTIETEKGEVLTEVSAILQYIADQKPELNLIPKAGSWDRYRAQEWLSYISTEIHKSFSVMFAADRWVANKEGNAQLKATVKEVLSGKLNFVAEKLEQRNFLVGEHFTVADAYLFVCLRWARHFGFDLANWPSLAKYVDRIRTRPKVQEAISAEG